jgi:hypothetical protein
MKHKKKKRALRALKFAEAIQDLLWWNGPHTQHDSDTLMGIANLSREYGFGPSVEQLTDLLKERYCMEDLNDHVQELKMMEAKSVNQSTFKEQVRYLFEQAGGEWIEEALLDEE